MKMILNAKRVNLIIGVVSTLLNFFIIFYGAVLLARFTWWLFTPSSSDAYVEKTSLSEFDNSSKFIQNRAPFGVVVAPPPPPKPTIASEIKITGLYLTSPENSMVFYQLNDKSYIAKIGDTIGGAAKVKSFTANGIVVIENDVNVEVSLQDGNSPSAVNVIQPSPGTPSSYTPNVVAPVANTQQHYEVAKANLSADNANSGSKDASNDNTAQDQNSTSQNNDLAQKRRKMIEGFMQRRNAASAATGSGDQNP